MNKLLKSLLCAGLVLGLAGCGSSGETNKTEEPESNQPKELQIDKTGYFLSDDTSPYVLYGIQLTNPNEKYYVNFPSFTITSYDSEGNILASDEQMLSSIAPGDTVYFSGQADCNQQVPNKVEFKVSNTESDYVENPVADPLVALEVGNTNIMQDGYSSSITGVVKNTTDEEINSAWLSAIFYKGDNIVGGAFTTSSSISPGGEVPFDMFIYRLPSDYDNYKVYAYNWM